MGDSPTTRRIDLDDGDAIDRGDGVATDGGKPHAPAQREYIAVEDDDNVHFADYARVVGAIDAASADLRTYCIGTYSPALLREWAELIETCGFDRVELFFGIRPGHGEAPVLLATPDGDRSRAVALGARSWPDAADRPPRVGVRLDELDREDVDRGDGVETDGGEETVWVVSNAGGQGDVYHKSPDCRNIKAESTVLAKARSIVGALDRCQTADCWGDHANDHGSRDHYHLALESDPDEVAPEPDDRLITDGGSDDILPDGGRETPPGIYLLNATGGMAPLATEDGGDTDLLYEALDEHVESQRPPQERLAEINEDLRDSDNIGEALLVGDFGLHTFYDPERTDYGVGTQTLLLEAFRQATEEIWLDEEIVRDNQGDVSPESVAAETVDQIHDLIGQSHFFNRYRSKLVEILRQADERHEWTDGDRDDDSDLVTDGGDRVDACPHCDSARVHRSRDDRTPAAERWTCYACRERFSDDEVIRRPPKASGPGLASELSALEPDDPMTDGGQPVAPGRVEPVDAYELRSDVPEDCQYQDCSRRADLATLVEDALGGFAVFCGCRSCFNEHAIYPIANELTGEPHDDRLIEWLDDEYLVTDGGTPSATCTHCGEAFPPDGSCRSGRGHDFVRASRLYSPRTGERTAHPACQTRLAFDGRWSA